MNYFETYDRLVQKRLKQPATGQYIECHHIIPKSEGGSDTQDNMVMLTAREHYIAHLLLAKIYNDSKMWFALRMMSPQSGYMRRTFRFNSRLFEHAKRIARELDSERKRGHNNPNFGKPVSAETRQKLSNALKGRKPAPMSLEARQRLSEQRKGKKLSDLAYQHAKQKLSKRVGQYDENGLLLNVYDSITSTAKAVGVSIFAISKCCRGMMRQCKGFTFKYLENDNG